jgi:hypothetical protein
MTKLKDWRWNLSEQDEMLLEELRQREERAMQADCDRRGTKLLLPKSRQAHAARMKGRQIVEQDNHRRR